MGSCASHERGVDSLRRTFDEVFPGGDGISGFALRGLALGLIVRLLRRNQPLAAQSVGVATIVGALFPGAEALGASLGYALSRIAPARRLLFGFALSLYVVVASLRDRASSHVMQLLLGVASAAIAVQVGEAAVMRGLCVAEGLAVLVVNADSGSSRLSRRAARAISRCAGKGLELIYVGSKELSGALHAAQYCTGEGGRVVVAGGDGTAGTAISIMSQGDGILGIVPNGTGNDLARSIGISLYPEEAAMVALGRSVRGIDVLATDLGMAAHAVNVGLVADFARRVRDVRGWRRPLVYPLVALGTWHHHRSVALKIRVDGEVMAREAQFYLNVAVLNAPRIGGRIGVTLPGASPDDGVAQLVTVARSAWRVVLGEIAGVLRQRARSAPRYAFVEEVGRVEMHSTSPFVVSLDGEPCKPVTHLRVQVVHHACRVAALPRRLVSSR